MSSNLAILVKNLGKLYQIYDKPQDRLKQSFFHGGKKFYKDFWALQNVSFSLDRGEAIGIIGRNGAGKSTLLQIIAGTLIPTEGEVSVNGKVAAMLELGSGFNLAFTGRENVFLSGSILGIAREEMEKRFEEIVNFADIWNFIDQPVKIYSSGMYARLAFATAINVSASVLIIDEILAVGDMGFQRKCYRRLEELIEDGTSILFVTHAIGIVRTFCSKALYLEAGRVKFIGSPKEACDLYLEDILEDNIPVGIGSEQNKAKPTYNPGKNSESKATIEKALLQYCTRCGRCTPFPKSSSTSSFIQSNGQVELVCVKLMSGDTEKTKVTTGDYINVRCRFRFSSVIEELYFGFLIRDKLGQDIFGVSKSSYSLGLQKPIQAGEEMEFLVNIKVDLRAGDYFITLGIRDMTFSEVLFYGHDILMFSVIRPSEEDPKLIGGIADLPHKLTIESF